jgi:hypothetical protein
VRHESQYAGDVFICIRTDDLQHDTAAATSITAEQIIFESAVILIGIVGALGNGTVLSVFCASKQLRKQDVNVLFINQLSLDFFCCIWLLVEYSLKMANIFLEGSTGYWLCIFILSEDLSYSGIFGSKINLMSIAIERYVKIVHPSMAQEQLQLLDDLFGCRLSVGSQPLSESVHDVIVDDCCGRSVRVGYDLDKRLSQVRSPNLRQLS